MEAKPAFLVFRVVIAVVLLGMFVALAVGSVVGLSLGGWYLGIFSVEHLRGKLLAFGGLAAFGCVGAAGVIAWSLVPRPDRFEPPGPEMLPEKQPDLFREIHQVAQLTGQAPPVHVYLVPEVNAFVTERGGFMGIGSRRVMGIGLSLVNALTISELRAVIAHEFGHFFGGDTKLGPWIYATRRTLGRTLRNLAGAQQATSESTTLSMIFVIVLEPFSQFGNLYLRATEAISRAQEFSADALAVHTIGATALSEGLKKTHRAGVAYQAYLSSEVVPLLENGRLPPLGEGFRLFLDSRAKGRLDELLAKELRDGKADPHDSHPPLKDRVAHALSLGGDAREDDARPAVSILKGVEELEQLLASRWVQDAPLTRVTWETSAEAFLPGWREVRAGVGRTLRTTTVLDLPHERPRLRQLATEMTGKMVGVSDDEVRGWAVAVLGGALAAALVEAGFTPESRPGEPIRARRDGEVVEPFDDLSRYFAGETTPEAWRARWEGLGLASLTIGSAEKGV